jgi:hypothetical protein
MTMLPDPLHPALVHLPIALAMLLPVFALAAAVAISRGALPPRFWGTLVALQILLAGSVWVALETGEQQEERVEKVVGHDPIEAHEEAAERLLWLVIGATLVSGTGLLPAGAGRAGRAATVVAGGIVLAAALGVGHSGGALVYEHGAADAYAKRTSSGPAGAGSDDAHDRD